MVKRSIDQKLRLRNFVARHGKIEIGAVVNNRKETRDVERGEGTCYQWKEKDQCVRRETSAVSGMRVTIVHKEPTPKAATLSEPFVTRGGGASWKRSVRGGSQTGRILRTVQILFERYLHRSPCEYWHPPGCHFYTTESGCKAWDKCLLPQTRLKNNQFTGRKKIFQNGKSEDECAVAILKNCTTIGLCLARLRTIRISEGNSSGETRCETSSDQFDEYDSHNLRYVKQVSENTEDHRSEKYTSQKTSSAKSLRHETWGQISRRDC